MTLLTEPQIAKILQYWEHRQNLEKEIRQLRAKYLYIEDLTDDEDDDECVYKAENKKAMQANLQITNQIVEINTRIEKIDAGYKKWLHEKIRTSLNDRALDEFSYNLIHNGIVVNA